MHSPRHTAKNYRAVILSSCHSPQSRVQERQMNASRISFVVCTVALFLVFPSFLLANLIAPNTRDWFSTRSQKKLKERIADLEIRLRFAEDQRTFTPAERGSARAKFVVGLIFGFAGLVILACVILVMGPSGLLVPSHSKLFVLLKITANVGYFDDVTGKICTRWNERESTWRKSGSCRTRSTNQSRS